jgi:uncharacterized protein (DUF433 family)
VSYPKTTIWERVTKVQRVETDPEILAGKPVTKGTRVPVHLILEMLGAGLSTADVVDEYPQLEEADVQAAIRYASHVIGSTEWVDFGVA